MSNLGRRERVQKPNRFQAHLKLFFDVSEDRINIVPRISCPMFRLSSFGAPIEVMTLAAQILSDKPLRMLSMI